ncbi:MAG TPA: RcpC/CpaB family pilus assembly protein [Pyrinomonadaceae bacterium]
MSAIAPPTAQPKGSKKLLFIALGLGLIAAAMNWLYLSRLEASTITVLKVKNQPVPAGTLATRNMFEPIRISGNLKQLQSFVLTESEFSAFEQKPVAETLQPGQLLLLRSFELSGANPVRDSIRPGERALSFNVAAEAGAVAYFVRPGDSVDIWGRVGGNAYKLKERTCVKAVGEQHITAEPSRAGSSKTGVSYNTVTVLVAENDVPNLIQNVAVAGQEVTLSLVGPCDSNAPNIPALAPLMDPKVKPSPSPAPQKTEPGPTPTH